MKEEIENRLHDFAELIYKQGFKAGEEKGLKDAWECARQIHGMHCQKLSEVFPYSTHDNIFIDYSAKEAMQKIKEYEKKQHDDEIDIGDVIRFLTSGTKAVIFDVDENNELWVLNEEGDASVVNPVDIVKTEKHIGSVAEILKQLRGEK